MKPIKHLITLLLLAGVLAACSNRPQTLLSSTEIPSATTPLSSSTISPTKTSPNPATGEWKSYTSQKLEGISFTHPTSLAEGSTAQYIPAFVDPSGFTYNDVPEHVRFEFTNPYTLQEPFASFQPGSAPWLDYQNPETPRTLPQVFIFPTGDYADINPLAGERIEALKTLLYDGALSAGDQLPVLPTFNSTQDFCSQVKPLAFQGGRGMRFITRYTQEAVPVVNPVVFYTFQGLTEDGNIYVAAFFPLYVSILPDKIQVEDWDAFSRGYQDYMADIVYRLERLGAGDFEPDLDSLDALISSITINLPEATR